MLKKGALVIIILISALLAIFSSLSLVSAVGCCADPAIITSDPTKFCQNPVTEFDCPNLQFFYDGIPCNQVADCITGTGHCLQPNQTAPTNCIDVDKKAKCNGVGFYRNSPLLSAGDSQCTKGCCVCVTPGVAAGSQGSLTQSACSTTCATAGNFVWNSSVSASACTGYAAGINPSSGQFSGFGSNITGYVFDENHNIIQGAPVFGGGASASTDNTGFFRLIHVSLGTYSAITSPIGYETNSSAVSVINNSAEIEANMSTRLLTTAVVTGYILNSAGQTIPGALVTINTTPNPMTTTSGTGGSYSFINILNGAYNVSASASGYAEGSNTVGVSGTGVYKVNVTLASGGGQQQQAGTSHLDVFVQNASGANIPGAEVNLQGLGICSIPQTGANPNCTYSNVQAPFTYTVDVAYRNSDKKYYGKSQQVTVSAQNTEVVITLLTRPKYSLEGTVYLPDELTEVIGAVVDVIDPETGNVLYTNTTDTNGFYRISGIPEAKHNSPESSDYNLEASRPGSIYLPDQDYGFELPSDLPHDFQLRDYNCVAPLSSPNITSIRPTKNERKLTVNWENSCQAKYYLLRCEGSAGCSKPYVFPETTNLQLVDTVNIKSNTLYCYAVNATYSNPVTTRQSGWNCTFTGDEECYAHAGEFCSSKDRYDCNLNNSKFQTEDCQADGQFDNTCIETSNGPRCTFQNPCGKCNRPFGLFFFPSGTTDIGGGSTSNCNNLYGSNLWPCYLDYGKTITDQFKECSAVKKCYDYKSQDACVKNQCIQDIQDGCEWIKTSFNQTGAGVCRPQNDTLQNASMCNLPAYNRVFGGCTKEVCSAYGRGYCPDANGDGLCDSPNGCIDIKDLSCWDYTSKSDCIGSGTSQRNASVNVGGAYPTGSTIFDKKQGNNTIIAPSSDLLGLGLCRFGSPTGSQGTQKCFKDADNSSRQDCINVGGDTATRSCKKDRTPPTTVVMHPSKSNKIQFTVFANDSNGIVDTYFSVSDSTSQTPLNITCYPRYKVINHVMNPATAQPNVGGLPNPMHTCTGVAQQSQTFPDGTYKVYYFSEDKSNNIEEVQSFNIELDSTPPTINTKVVKSTISQNPPVTNIYIDVNSSELVWCDGNLTKGTSIKKKSAINVTNSPQKDWRENWAGLGDGLWKYSLDCIDGVGNPKSIRLNINIEADKTITNPQPNETINYTDVMISIDTEEPANCTYREVGGSTSAFGTTGGTHHNDSINFASRIPTSGLFHTEYNVTCTLASTGQPVNGNDADIIKITIDQQAPKTDAWSGSQKVTIPEWISTPNFEFRCDDDDANFNADPEEFGCRDLMFCYGNSCAPSSTGLTLYTPSFTASTNISYQSVDNGGNVEAINTKNIKYDPVPPSVYNVEFPDTPIINGEYTTASSPARINGSFADAESDVVSAFIINNRGDRKNLTFTGSNPYDFDTTIDLDADQENTITVYATDKAGNNGSTEMTILHDGTGPSIDNFEIQTACSGGCRFNKAARITQTYYDSIAFVYNVVDSLGVDKVWLIDPLGAKSIVPQITQNEWQNTVQSKLWPYGVFTVTVAANDTFGNINTKDFVINVTDTVVPGLQQVLIRDVYNNPTSGNLSAGRYYAIFKATEPLSTLNLNYKYQNDTTNFTEPVFLLSRTFNGTEWLAYFDVNDNVTASTNAGLNASLVDRHGIAGNEIRYFGIDFTQKPTPVLPGSYTPITFSQIGLNALKVGSTYVTAAQMLNLEVNITGVSGTITNVFIIGEDMKSYTPIGSSGIQYFFSIPLVGALLQEHQNDITLLVNTTSGYYGMPITIIKDLAPPQLISLGIES